MSGDPMRIPCPMAVQGSDRRSWPNGVGPSSLAAEVPVTGKSARHLAEPVDFNPQFRLPPPAHPPDARTPLATGSYRHHRRNAGPANGAAKPDRCPRNGTHHWSWSLRITLELTVPLFARLKALSIEPGQLHTPIGLRWATCMGALPRPPAGCSSAGRTPWRRASSQSRAAVGRCQDNR